MLGTLALSGFFTYEVCRKLDPSLPLVCGRREGGEGRGGEDGRKGEGRGDGRKGEGRGGEDGRKGEGTVWTDLSGFFIYGKMYDTIIH